MIKYSFYFLPILFFSTTLWSQQLFKVEWEYKADLNVFEVDQAYKADLLVYEVEREYKAKDNVGLWYFTDLEYKADLLIYMVDQEYKADLKIFFVEWEYQSGWKNEGLRSTVDVLLNN